jgi:chromate transporter
VQKFAEIFIYFLKLGATGFGGPLALISIMQKELVEEKKWMSSREFAEALSLIKAMPGALAFQTAVYLGRHRGGRWGGTAAGIGLLLPSFILMVLLAQFYYLAENILSVRIFFNGMQAAAVVLMIQALRMLSMPYFRSRDFWLFFVIGGIIFYLNLIPEPLLILGSGALGVLWSFRSRFVNFMFVSAEVFPVIEFSLSKIGDLAWVCLKAGAVVFGSGLAIVPLLARDFVDKLHWITTAEFLDALALGQITPGPVLITVTFIGFKVAGLLGAVIATVAVFLPGFFHMQTWFPPMVNVLRRQKWIDSFLIPALGVICGVLLVTIVKITEGWHQSWKLMSIVFICALIGTLMKLPSWALIFIGGILSLVF